MLNQLALSGVLGPERQAEVMASSAGKKHGAKAGAKTGTASAGTSSTLPFEAVTKIDHLKIRGAGDKEPDLKEVKDELIKIFMGSHGSGDARRFSGAHVRAALDAFVSTSY